MSTDEISVSLTGLSLNAALAKVKKFADEILATKEAEFMIAMQDAGYDATIVEEIIEGQRPVVEAQRAVLLGAVMAYFSYGGGTAH